MAIVTLMKTLPSVLHPILYFDIVLRRDGDIDHKVDYRGRISPTEGSVAVLFLLTMVVSDTLGNGIGRKGSDVEEESVNRGRKARI